MTEHDLNTTHAADKTARKSGVEIRVSGWTALIVVCTINTFRMLWLVA